MSWNEIWTNYIMLPVTTALAGVSTGAIVYFLVKSLINVIMRKVYNKKHLGDLTNNIVDKVVKEPVTINLETNQNKNFEVVKKELLAEQNKLKEIIVKQTVMFEYMLELFNNSYAMTEDQKKKIQSAINEVKNVCEEEIIVEDTTKAVIEIEKEEPKKVEKEKKTTIER